MNKLLAISLISIFFAWIVRIPMTENKPAAVRVEAATPLSLVLEQLGDKPQPKPNMNIKGVSVERGRELFTGGRTTSPNGTRTPEQSPYFKCIACHNTQREDPDLAKSDDPNARLQYVKDHNLKFLQGTTMWGIANRTSFYNGDYFRKYGDLVKKTRNDIREAIQLCAIACSQGRTMKDWEVESVLAYYWSLEIKTGDLDLQKSDYQAINDAINTGVGKEKLISMLKSKYKQDSPATFVLPPTDLKKGYGLKGNIERGKIIYDLSCLHCHARKVYSYFELDQDKMSFKFLKKAMTQYSRYSLYQVGRWGTEPMHWKRAYMPFFTAEKMSNQQIEDLRLYIETASE
jgi:mono/diheme cytochrome c family protein